MRRAHYSQSRKPMNTSRRLNRPLPEIFVSIFIGVGLFLLVLFLVNFNRPERTPVGVVTAMLTVIPAPTDTPAPPTSTPSTPTPSPGDIPSAPGNLSVGAFVQVSGTEGDGLRLRQGPGLEFDPEYLGLEAEIFEIIDGPQNADGYIWWHLVTPSDETRNGWAVSNYLEIVENP
jgi:hypothetical protein